jgi:hypothetical protein
MLDDVHNKGLVCIALNGLRWLTIEPVAYLSHCSGITG